MKGITVKSSNLQKVLNATETIVDEMVLTFKEWFLNQYKKAATDYDVECYRIDVVVDLIMAFGRYIKDTDVLHGIEIRKNKGVVVLTCHGVRDDKTFSFSTRRIVAGGHAIQCLHYRYISDTNLPSLTAEVPDAEALKARKVHMSKVERMKKEMESKVAYKEREVANYTRKMNMSDDEIYASSFLTKFAAYDYATQVNHERYPTKADWEAQLAKDRKEKIAEHRAFYTAAKVANVEKYHNADIKKYQAKIDKLVASV